MLRQVYDTLKSDSTKGDFVSLIEEDMDEIGCDLTEEDIINMSKTQWKEFINEMIFDPAAIRRPVLPWMSHGEHAASNTPGRAPHSAVACPSEGSDKSRQD